MVVVGGMVAPVAWAVALLAVGAGEGAVGEVGGVAAVVDAQPEASTATAKVATRAINEAISFKEGALHEIRIKLL